MRSRSAERVTCSRISPSRARLSTPRQSSPATPTSFSRLRHRVRVRRGLPTGSVFRPSPRCVSTGWLRSRTRPSVDWVPASSTPPRICVAPLRGSVAEVRELQRHIELRAAQQSDRRLQLIALLAADAHLLALNARLNLELRVLHQSRDLPAGVRIDTVAQHHLLVRGGKCGLRLLGLQAGEIDAALGEAELQDLQHLLELKVHLRMQRDDEFLQLEACAGVLEVEALRELAVRLVDGVGDLVRIELGDGIEGGHI